MSYWLYPDAPAAYVDLSTDNIEDTRAAADYWVTASVAAVGFVCLVCALAWWHQRRLRKLFKDEAETLNESLRSHRPTFETLSAIPERDVDESILTEHGNVNHAG